MIEFPIMIEFILIFKQYSQQIMSKSHISPSHRDNQGADDKIIQTGIGSICQQSSRQPKNPQLKSNCKRVKSIPILVVCRIQIKQSIEAIGVFCYKNGTPIKLGHFFSSSQIEGQLPEHFTVDPLTKNIYIKFELSVRENKNDCVQYAQKEMEGLLNQSQNKLAKILIISGATRSFSETAIQIRYHKLETRDKLYKLLDHKGKECCEKQLRHQKKNTIPKNQSCIEEMEEIKCYKNSADFTMMRHKSSDSTEIYQMNPTLVRPDGSDFTQMLALKRIPEKDKSLYLQNIAKLQKQKTILKQLKKAQYLPRYYTKVKQSNNLWMEYVPSSLSHKIIENQLSTMDKIDIMRQITTGVRQIHEQGIVHRDLKPNNILIKEHMGNNGRQLYQAKIIDFGESIQSYKELTKESFQSKNFEKLGATLPYSPLECSVLCPDGYSKLKIDNWSIGILLSELMLGKMPICYTKCQRENIRTGWITSEFTFNMNMRMVEPLSHISFALRVLSMSLMKLKYQERICLQPIEEALKDFAQVSLEKFL